MIQINNKRSKRIDSINKHLDNLVGQRLNQNQIDHIKNLLQDAILVGQNVAVRYITDPINFDRRLGRQIHSKRQHIMNMKELMRTLEDEDYQPGDGP